MRATANCSPPSLTLHILMYFLVLKGNKNHHQNSSVCREGVRSAGYIQRSPASSEEQARGGRAMLPEPTVSGGRREVTYLLSGSLKQDMWVVAKVTVVSRHPCDSEGVLLTVTWAQRHRQASTVGKQGRLRCLRLAYCSNQPGGAPPSVCS